MACEEAFSTKTKMLRAAANGEIHASIGRFTVGLIGTWVTCSVVSSAVALMVLFPTVWVILVGALVSGAIGLLFTRWWRRTPPRKLTAKSGLRRLRSNYLRKRAPKQLGEPDSA